MSVDFIVDGFLGTKQPLFITMITFLSCLAVAALLVIIGYMRKKAKPADSKEQVSY